MDFSNIFKTSEGAKKAWLKRRGAQASARAAEGKATEADVKAKLDQLAAANEPSEVTGNPKSQIKFLQGVIQTAQSHLTLPSKTAKQKQRLRELIEESKGKIKQYEAKVKKHDNQQESPMAFENVFKDSAASKKDGLVTKNESVEQAASFARAIGL